MEGARESREFGMANASLCAPDKIAIEEELLERSTY
jgi:hypothetical protein